MNGKLKRLLPLFFLLVSAGVARPDPWVAMPPPADMPGDDGHWWLDMGSIVHRGSKVFFIFERSAEKGIPPRGPGGMGRTALDCASGQTWVEGVCSGTCDRRLPFPLSWSESAPHSRGDRLYDRVCTNQHQSLRRDDTRR